ncbi:hypothetical protein ITX31_13080 [Arthrobacter gandavensis]|uniref:hypothetical protein n=1 Tax=Arthrobacter gandavensis TaxID=169960 RepID=UPI00188E164A|nr:hypothetical protein [Arthrobacter gandavensis]MBF4995036.1 hypothetical protein [Arthrobacter gandavensis]
MKVNTTMEIGRKAKKIIVWSASGLAAAGLLTGTFITGMAVADNTEPASATSEVDGARPEPPQRGQAENPPGNNGRQHDDSQHNDSRDGDSQDKDSGNQDAPDQGRQDRGTRNDG